MTTSRKMCIRDSVCSLGTILFAQIAKLVTVALSTGFLVYDLSVAPVMVVGAIAGGFLGASLSKRFSEAGVERDVYKRQPLISRTQLRGPPPI